MTIEKLNEVDAVGIDNETGYVTLIIIDHLDWEDEVSHLRLLQEKINRYLSFWESGEVYETYPEADGRKMEIKIYVKHDLPQICIEFLERVSQIIGDEGFVLSYKVTG